MGKGLVILSLLMMASLESSKALEIQGVTLDQQVRVCGETLKLNGAGLRAFRILMIPLKIYVVAFDAPAPLHTSSMVLDSPGPLQFDFTFLRGRRRGRCLQSVDFPVRREYFLHLSGL